MTPGRLLLWMSERWRGPEQAKGKPLVKLAIFRICLLVAWVITASSVRAQTLSIRQFQPAPGSDQNYNHVEGVELLEPWEGVLGVGLNYAARPLNLVLATTGETLLVLDHVLEADIQAGIGLGRRLQLGVVMPVTLVQVAGESDLVYLEPPLTQLAGDVRLSLRARLVGGRPGWKLPTLALAVTGTLPTGDEASLHGEVGPTLEPRLVSELHPGARLRLGVNLGYILRQTQSYYALTVGNELTYGVGVAYQFEPQRLSLIGELYGRLPAGPGTRITPSTTPLEAALSGRWHISPHNILTIGAGKGLSYGYGTPALRIFAGFSHVFARAQVIRQASDGDVDGDRVPDLWDRCPSEPEDRDTVQDEDGCPDPDNDGDGVPDLSDRCPNQSETLNGSVDDDGCPDSIPGGAR